MSLQSDRPIKRCAIYTRKSTEHALGQEFTSLQAQHGVCKAYIQSQQHRGWVEAYRSYEDAAQSGATLERPAMQDLLADVERGLVDVIVVYKLDRLSRSLLDFVRLLDLFERYGVTFVCITQNFDTADSLGRLVMNVLLTFAQFEREMTGDRIRDKRRAMCARGLWSGGRAPFGYDLVDHKLQINAKEAAIVGRIFERFLHFRTYSQLERECQAGGVFTKTWVTRHGILIKGTPMRAATIRKILTNPVYAGYLVSGNDRFRGVQEPIISEALWEEVSKLLQRKVRERAIVAQRDLFDGLIFDCFGRRMKCDRQFRRNRWTAHYRSYQTEWGRAKGIRRVGMNARKAEQLVIAAIQALLKDPERLRPILLALGSHESGHTAAKGESASRFFDRLTSGQLRSVIRGLIVRIEVSRARIHIVIRKPELERFLNWDCIALFRNPVGGRSRDTYLLEVPCAGAVRLERSLSLPIGKGDLTNTRQADRRLVALIREARQAQALIEMHRDQDVTELASRMKRNRAYFTRLLKLNYLAPDIALAILDGDQPPHLTRKSLVDADLPLDWALQRQLLGFREQPLTQTCEERY